MPGYEAERLTCALPDGLPSFFNRWQRYDKIPKPPNDFGIFCTYLDKMQLFYIVFIKYSQKFFLIHYTDFNSAVL